jgi:hypothetical protein
LTISANNILSSKVLTVKNTLAHFSALSVTKKKSFMTLKPGGGQPLPSASCNLSEAPPALSVASQSPKIVKFML